VTSARLILVAMLLATAALYAPVLAHGYVFDDVPAISDNPVVLHGTLGDVASHDYWGGRPGFRHVTTYRPLTTLTFWLEARLGGLSPWRTHLINLLLHLGSVALLAAVLRRMGVPPPTAWLATGLFAVHPVHLEAVAGAVNRAELLAFVLGAGALLAWITCRRRAAVAMFGLALFAKENAVTVLPLMLAWDLWLDPSRSPQARPGWRRLALRHAPLLALVAAMLALRASVLPAVLGGRIPSSDNPLVDADLAGRLLTPFKILTRALANFLVPASLSPDYSVNQIPPAGWLDREAWTGLALAVMAPLAAWRLRERVPALLLGVLAFAVTWSVASNLAFLNTILYADRLLYLPSAGLCLALAAVASVALAGLKPRVLGWLLLGAWGTGLLICHFSYIFAWKDDAALFAHAVRTAPDSARARVNLAAQLQAGGQPVDAERHLRAAARLDPHDPAARANLGGLLLVQGRLEQAQRELLHALFLDLGSVEGWNNWCHLLLRAGRGPDALAPCQRAHSLAPGSPTVLENLGAACLAAGRLDEGAQHLLEAIERGHAKPEGIVDNLARLARQSGKVDELGALIPRAWRERFAAQVMRR
jgi:Flp pilus assembly protein TadD